MSFQAIDSWYGRVASAASIAALAGFLASYFLTDPITLSSRTQIVGLTIVTFAAALIFISYKLISEYAHFQSPRLIQVIEGVSGSIFLFQPARWITHHFQYSIFYVNDIENYLGTGFVINIQNDRKIQIIVSPEGLKAREIYDRLLKAARSEMDRVIIKPGFIADV